ncbi:hypothetical protein AAHE18_15G281400 [Arachis hypogaea]
MSGNSFSGNLSKHLCYLKKLQLLDLSRNNLSNEIPTCLKNFTAMSKKSINSTETASLIYWYNDTYIETYGFTISRYTFNITVMWKGVKCGFKSPELRLNSIDLSSNDFIGEIPNEIVFLVGLFSLNLSRNNLSGEIPSEIGNITSLESLDLSKNHISGTIPSSLSQIDNLGVLELSNNSLYGRIPPGRHMDTFDGSCFEGNPNLCGTQLNKTCPGDMPEVKPEEPTRHDDADDNSDFYEALHMSLGFGFFTGFWGLLGPLLFWSGSICSKILQVTQRLQEMLNTETEMRDTSLVAITIGVCTEIFGVEWVSNLSFLNTLDLTSMSLGNSHHWLQMIGKHIPNLTELSLTDTSFLVSSTSIVNSSSSLVSLDLYSNLLTSSNIFHWIFNFTANLHTLYLGYNLLEGPIPLGYLDISDAGIHGTVPEWVWYKFQVVGYHLNMSHNNFIGAIPSLPPRLSVPGAYIDLSSNQFEGTIPSFLQHAWWLILSENKFSDVSSLLCDNSTTATSSLVSLDLTNNQINGQLPDCWGSVNTLLFLDLSNNNLSGKIPPSMGSLNKLEALVLRNNSLMGELPSSLKNCTNLFVLDVAKNLLSGPIPFWIGDNLQQLILLSMSENHFSGNLSMHLCHLEHIQVLDLSRNKLSDGIPTCIKNFTAISKRRINITQVWIYGYGSLGHYIVNITLMWKGVENWFKDPEFSLKAVDLSGNYLTGEIPKEIGYLVGLNELNLSRNNLKGEIPSEIGNLTSLDFLDLSRNDLCGRIPSSLSQIDGIGVLDLSYNNLSGRIPSGGHMDTFEASFFEGNPNLCGEQLNKTCPEDMTPTKPQESTTNDEADDNSDFYEALYMSLGFGFFIGFWGLLGPLLFWRCWRIAYLRFLNKVADYIYVMVALNMRRFHN